MIDFKKKRFSYISGSDEKFKEQLKIHSEDIKKYIDLSKTDFFYIGVHLIDLYRSDAYSIYAKEVSREKMAVEYNLPIGAGNLCAEFFFAYCEKEFNLDKTQVSRYMNIVDEFGEAARGFKERYKPFGYSQLCEMLPLSEEERKSISPDWTIKRIREYKKMLAENMTCLTEKLSEDKKPPQDERYARFEKWNKRELCDKIFELESERDSLLEEISRLNIAAEQLNTLTSVSDIPVINKKNGLRKSLNCLVGGAE